MAKRPIPFPHLDPAAEPEPIVKHRGEIVIRLGNKRYAIDITTSVRPLPARTSKGQSASQECYVGREVRGNRISYRYCRGY